MHSLAYGYDANANLSQLMYPGGHVVTYAPDALGRATQITGTGGEIYASGISYHPGGAIAGFTYGNGVVHAMTQNARKLPAHSTDTFGRFAVLDDTYVFDANGNVDYMADAAGTGNQNRTKDLGYDDLDRLIVADAPNQWITATYAYDPLDNLRIADQGTRQYRYNYNATTNLLTDIKTPAGATVFGFTYDARGNTTAKGAQGYTFDVANRMNAVNSVQEYLYDGQGRRVRTGNLADGKRTTWIYSQAGQVMYTDEEPTNKQLFYVYLGNTQVAVRSYDKVALTATVKYQHTDSLGSPVAETIANPTSTNTVRHSYAPYGEGYGEPMGGSVSGTGYTGHVMDRGTNLTYMQQRYYDPQVGRFLSKDPIPTNPDSGVGFGVFEYAASNPFKYYDPDGRKTTCSANVCTMTADTFDETLSTGQTTVASPEVKSFVESIKDTVDTGSGPEVLTFVVNGEGSGLAVKDGEAGNVSTLGGGSVASADPPDGAIAGAHWHIDEGVRKSDGLVDSPKLNGGYGDTGALKNGLPMATISQGQVAWNEISGGQLQFTYPKGAMDKDQQRTKQNNLNKEQKLFFKESKK